MITNADCIRAAMAQMGAAPDVIDSMMQQAEAAIAKEAAAGDDIVSTDVVVARVLARRGDVGQRAIGTWRLTAMHADGRDIRNAIGGAGGPYGTGVRIMICLNADQTEMITRDAAGNITGTAAYIPVAGMTGC